MYCSILKSSGDPRSFKAKTATLNGPNPNIAQEGVLNIVKLVQLLWFPEGGILKRVEGRSDWEGLKFSTCTWKKHFST